MTVLDDSNEFSARHCGLDPQSRIAAGCADVSWILTFVRMTGGGVEDNLFRMKGGWVYILASRRNGTLYIGVTAKLAERIWAHKQKVIPGFTAEYGVDRLVYMQHFDRIEDAIAEEKRLKNWKRAWKIELIERDNPEWNDLYETLHH